MFVRYLPLCPIYLLLAFQRNSWGRMFKQKSSPSLILTILTVFLFRLTNQERYFFSHIVHQFVRCLLQCTFIVFIRPISTFSTPNVTTFFILPWLLSFIFAKFASFTMSPNPPFICLSIYIFLSLFYIPAFSYANNQESSHVFVSVGRKEVLPVGVVTSLR